MKVRRPLPRKTEANQHRAFEKMINKSKERTKAHLADLREANNKLTEVLKQLEESKRLLARLNARLAALHAARMAARAATGPAPAA